MGMVRKAGYEQEREGEGRRAVDYAVRNMKRLLQVS